MFVNMTAAWCVTCLVNERVAISTRRRASAPSPINHVTYLKGDWTRQDPEITHYLRENGRDGVPLYVYYPPRGQPAVLPQILTENTLLGAVGRADQLMPQIPLNSGGGYDPSGTSAGRWR